MGAADSKCPKCGEVMEWGEARIKGSPLVEEGVRIAFIVPGTKTSANPFRAFRQGLADEPGDRIDNLWAMTAARCSGCGFLEFYAR